MNNIRVDFISDFVNTRRTNMHMTRFEVVIVKIITIINSDNAMGEFEG